MSPQIFIPNILMGKHWHHHQSSESVRSEPEPEKASAQPSRPTSITSSLLSKLSRGREGNTSQPAPSPAESEKPTATPSPSPASPAPVQPLAHDPPRPARPVRIPAVTSKAMTTAPVKDKSRPHRRKYPNNMRQRL